MPINLDLLERHQHTLNLLKGIENSKNQLWKKKLYGLGINHIGQVTAKNICNKFNCIEDLKEASLNNPNKLMEINGIGDEIIESLKTWFESEDNIKLIRMLHARGVLFQNEIDENPITNIENNEMFLDSMSSRRLGGERNDSLIALSLGTSPNAH